MSDNIILLDSDASTIGQANGWACLVVDGDKEELHSGWQTGMTNNETELYGILMALLFCPHNRQVIIWTDSKIAAAWFWRRPDNETARQIYWAIKDVIRESHIQVIDLIRVPGHQMNHTHAVVDEWATRMANIGFNNI